MTDIIIVIILVLVIGGAGFYVYKAKKSGKKCIGCPDSGACSGGCQSGGSGCAGCSGCCGTKK